jgi:hypothetical protein
MAKDNGQIFKIGRKADPGESGFDGKGLPKTLYSAAYCLALLSP